MKILIIIPLIIFLQIHQIISQNWSFKTEILSDNSSILKGFIDSTYPITLYLKPFEGTCDNQGYGRQWQHKIFSGWYSYDKYEIRTPLLGAIGFGDMNAKIRLYVPENYNDTIVQFDCSIEDYKEMFFAHDHNDETKLKWIKKGSKDTLFVNLSYVKRGSAKTQANLSLEINGIEMKVLDFSKLSGLDYIDNIYNLDIKLINGKFFLTFNFGESSTPGGLGGGNCGAGYEEYLGFLYLNEKFEPVEFDKKLIDSCVNYGLVEKYRVHQGNPELGLERYD